MHISLLSFGDEYKDLIMKSSFRAMNLISFVRVILYVFFGDEQKDCIMKS